ncbi:MAG: PilZ domain-containing protein [Solidesulfovibrio magneticus str. Maddingley MBC34]|uniref:PilZ domain-containing protein n=1 Tax=Solidesulfovibrio magneticus str. Maddingley MBC34 TaxID=1206767 RepID=K6GLT6_9BACT|nr:MAG: PilZ domain-containing protein [Solidesulfovibrio magneticus str. Maddingley MBC34]
MSAPDINHFHCPPGAKVILELSGLPDKLATVCVGHVRGRFVVTQAPAVPETGREALYQLLYPDNTAIVRYLHDGTVVGFSTRVIRFIQIPFPLVFFTFPKKLESHDLRRHPRIACCLPGQACVAGADLPGMVMDLSHSGCLFSAALPETAPAVAPPVAIDDDVLLRCGLFGQSPDTALAGVVKRVALSGRRLELGLKFRKLPEPARQAIGSYLDQALSILG